MCKEDITLAEFEAAKAFYEKELNQKVGKLQYKRIIKLAKILKTHTGVKLVCNRNLRYDRAKNRLAIKIGQTNDTLRGYPKYIIWVTFDK